LKYSFHPAAEKELTDAVDYYNDCQNGLGQEFAKEIYRTVQNILHFPMHGHHYQKIPEDA
jgi:hypothetical protein